MTIRVRTILLGGILAIGVGAAPSFAADATVGKASKPAKDPKEKKPKSDTPPPDAWGQMDYGPFLMTSVARQGGKPLRVENFESPLIPNFPVDQTPDLIASRGIVIPVGRSDDPTKEPVATVCFNTETLGMTAWTGGWLDLRGSMFINHKGTFNVTSTGIEVLSSRGPVAPGKLEFLGHYVNGRDVVLSYRVDGIRVLEMPGYVGEGGSGYFTRTIQVDPHTQPLKLNLGTFAKNGRDVPIHVEFEPSDKPSTRRLQFGEASETRPLTSLTTLITGGSPLWKPITTQGVVGKPTLPSRGNRGADPSFVVDNLTLPIKNPWNSWMRLSGVDFFSDGRAVICTINGDVWVVSNIDASLSNLTWTRFATGLYQPLGLCVVNDKVCVRGRDQLTRLHDLNNDGEADFYENVSTEGESHPSYHALVFDLLADKAGDFFYARGGLAMNPAMENFGRLLKLSADGKTTTLATGLRQPNGIGLVGDNWITVSDNQGNWIPSSKIHLVDSKAAGQPPFLGYLPHHHQDAMPKEPQQPLVWIPHTLDNSSGGQCEVPAGAWGDYSGQWIHTSFGSASVMVLLPDGAAAKGEMPKQAAVARLPLDFATGIMRPRFSPTDKQLYIAGVGGGWQTKGTADGGLYRVRYIQPDAKSRGGVTPTAFAVVPGGVRLSFPQPLDKKEAADPQNYAVEQWNYVWTEKYGSPDFSAKTPGKAGHDEVEVTGATVSDDGKSVTLQLADFKPVNQLLIESIVFTDDGKEFESTVYATVNESK